MKPKLNILFICSWYPSRVLKSNGDFIQRHAKAVVLQHNVTVIHVKTDKNTVNKIEITDHIINNVRTLIAYVKPSKNPILKISRFINAYKKLVQKAGSFDVIHVHKFYPAGLIAYFINKRKKTPYLITEHHTLYHKPYCNKIGIAEKTLSKLIVKNASFVCPVSDDLGNAIQNFGLNGNFCKVPNVVDIDRFKPLTKKDKTFTILHVSSMAKVKNIKGILRTIKQLETKIIDFKFLLVGSNAEDFKIDAKNLDIDLSKTKFKNQVSHQEITSYFQKASVFVLFSEVENLPCVILESFACGTPVISTDVGGISEYFPSDFGLLIKPNNEEALLNAILKMHTNFKKATADEMYKYVDSHFSKEQICKEFTQLYLKSLN